MKFAPLSSAVVLLSSLTAFSLFADEPKVMRLIHADSIITVSQPEALAGRLNGKEVPVTGSDEERAAQRPVATGGYRVQIFADNNARTAKNEARAKAVAIHEQLPHLSTYVTYDAPYWRLRVGDFRSEVDAEAAAAEIKHYFPQYSREVRVVRDKINVSRNE